jgi:beta-N-acetylhexosaminidase
MRKDYWIRLCLIALILFSMLPAKSGLAAPFRQDDGGDLQRAQDLLERMTPEERVGQLFLVTFPDTNVGADTEIFDLIYNYYIGGVILLDKNNNFVASENAPSDTWSLINQLQTNRFSSSQEPRTNPDTGETFNPAYVPLFVGTSQEGDGYPTDQILDQLTPLPSQLAIGATWDPAFARQVGAVAGEELASLGINLLLGPSLDVNENPKTEGVGDIGVRTFGGDPFWVGEMGRAYISGVHQGSEGRMAVVSKHFPGLGSSDRLPIDEVATVRKLLEQLKQIELAPFFAVTGNANNPEETTDALLTSHIRYQGLTENIRATTRPVSFDQAALGLLMELPALTTWRSNGGVMISDDIGSRAVRNFYDPTGEGFNLRRAAQDALLAGNDLLYMGGFLNIVTPATEEEPAVTNYDALIDTLEFFTQKYREDPGFAERVDEATLRILALKYKLYGFFTLTMVLASGEIGNMEANNQVSFGVAQQAATLINPSIEEIENVLPDTPTRSERIIIFTDSFDERACPQCESRESIAVDAMANAILSLYGQEAGGVIYSGNISSHSFIELEQMLDGQAVSSAVDTNLRRAQWIIFLPLDINPDRSESYALRRFLSERTDLSRDKRVIAFAANAPYYLDATDIAKLTAYYGLYSKTPAFVDVAARLLFKEIPVPEGASPVSIPGIGYDLITVTSPNPFGEIFLLINLPGFDLPDNGIPSNPMPVPQFRIGDRLPIRTSIIKDHNGNPVPDNTPVQFSISIDGNEAPAITSETIDGIATAEFLIEQSGIIEVQAIAGDAQSSSLILEVDEERQTPTPSATVPPTETPTLEPSPTQEEPTPTPFVEIEPEPNFTGLFDWLLALAISMFTGWAALRVGASIGQVRWGVRWGFAALIGGLMTYTYATIQLPGTAWTYETPYHWGLLLITFLGALLGWGIGAIVRIAGGNNNSRT